MSIETTAKDKEEQLPKKNETMAELQQQLATKKRDLAQLNEYMEFARDAVLPNDRALVAEKEDEISALSDRMAALAAGGDVITPTGTSTGERRTLGGMMRAKRGLPSQESEERPRA